MHLSAIDGRERTKRCGQAAPLGLLLGFAADLVLRDPPRLHPVAGFGHLALSVERRLYAPRRRRGAELCLLLLSCACVPAHLLQMAAQRTRFGRVVVLVAFAFATLGGGSLIGEATAIAALLQAGDLEQARERLPALVGRDVEELSEEQVSRAVIESVAENTADAVIGVLLWGALFGPAGMAGFRAANTLDAMFGHRDARYGEFGWACARLDDLLAAPAARVGAVLAAAMAPLVGGARSLAWRTLRRDGRRHPSPNAGLMEAVFAGALGVRLGGTLSYNGIVEHRPTLGEGPSPQPADIERAVRLSLAVGSLCVISCASAQLIWAGSAGRAARAWWNGAR